VQLESVPVVPPANALAGNYALCAPADRLRTRSIISIAPAPGRIDQRHDDTPGSWYRRDAVSSDLPNALPNQSTGLPHLQQPKRELLAKWMESDAMFFQARSIRRGTWPHPWRTAATSCGGFGSSNNTSPGNTPNIGGADQLPHRRPCGNAVQRKDSDSRSSWDIKGVVPLSIVIIHIPRRFA